MNLFLNVVWIVAYATLVKTANGENSTDTSVTIYTEGNFWGIPWSLSIPNCTDVPGLLYKKTSSIDTHGNCVILFSRQECQGRRIRIAPGTSGHSHLSEVNFNDKLASLKPCKDMDSWTPGNHEDPTVNQVRRRRRGVAEVPFMMELMKRLGISMKDSKEEEPEDDGNNENEADGVRQWGYHDRPEDDNNGDQNQDTEDSQETGNGNGQRIFQTLLGSLKMNNENEGGGE